MGSELHLSLTLQMRVGWSFHSLCMEIVQKVRAVGIGVYLYNLDETEQTEKKTEIN